MKKEDEIKKLINVEYKPDKKNHRWLKIETYVIDSPSRDVLRDLKKAGVDIKL